jgi:hypothetical protein
MALMTQSPSTPSLAHVLRGFAARHKQPQRNLASVKPGGPSRGRHDRASDSASDTGPVRRGRLQMHASVAETDSEELNESDRNFVVSDTESDSTTVASAAAPQRMLVLYVLMCVCADALLLLF